MKVYMWLVHSWLWAFLFDISFSQLKAITYERILKLLAPNAYIVGHGFGQQCSMDLGAAAVWCCAMMGIVYWTHNLIAKLGILSLYDIKFLVLNACTMLYKMSTEI